MGNQENAPHAAPSSNPVICSQTYTPYGKKGHTDSLGNTDIEMLPSEVDEVFPDMLQ